MIGRRTFLGVLGTAAVSLMEVPGRSVREAEVGVDLRKIDRIGLQLYSVRDAMRRDMPGTLDHVARIGYREVEFAGYFGRSPADVRGLLKRYDLTAPSTHLDYGLIARNWSHTLDDAKAIGHEWVTIPSFPGEDAHTPDGVRRVAGVFNQAAAAARAQGLRFAYHNHDFEFQPFVTGREGAESRPYDILIEHTDPQLVDFEMDLYWITMAGGDPLTYFSRYPGRFAMVHVKDSKGAPRHEMADVGACSIDFARIFARSREAGIRHYFVEHDEPRDPFASIMASHDYLARLEF